MRSWGRRAAVALALVSGALLVGCGSSRHDSSASTATAGAKSAKAHKDPWSCPASPSTLKGYAGPTSGRPLVPGLLGHAPEDACQQLASRHLRAQFAPLDYPCTHRPPSGGVTWQQPTAGSALHHGAVLVGTSTQNTCGSASAEQRCQRNQVHLTADGAESGYAGGSGQVSLQAVITNTDSSACELNSTVHVTLRDQGGHFLGPIWGNPSTIHVHHALEPIQRHGEPLTIEWVWISWCDPPRRVRLSTDMAGFHSSDETPTPLCVRGFAPYMQGANVNLGALP